MLTHYLEILHGPPALPTAAEQVNDSTAVTAQISPDPIEELNKTVQESHLEQLREARSQQQGDPDLQAMMVYLEEGKLPEEDKVARRLVMESSSYELLDGVLHHQHPTDPGKWCLVVPKEEQPKILAEHHGGRFAGHFAERKMYATLRCQYWWKGMRSDVHHHCRSCLICATRKGTGRQSRPPLQSIQVGGPFIV